MAGDADLQNVLSALPEGCSVATGCWLQRFDGIEGGVAPVQQLLAFVGARILLAVPRTMDSKRRYLRWGNRLAVATGSSQPLR